MNDLPCLICEKVKMESNLEYKTFLKKYRILFNDIDNLNSILVVKEIDLVNTISKYLNCIGCRRETVNIYEKIKCLNKGTCLENMTENDLFQTKCAINALDPMYVDTNGDLKLKKDLINPSFLYLLFNMQG
jgi:hypothetical protein